MQDTEVLDKEEEGQSEQESEDESSEYEEYTGIYRRFHINVSIVIGLFFHGLKSEFALVTIMRCRYIHLYLTIRPLI